MNKNLHFRNILNIMNISFRVIIPAHYVFLHKMLGIKPKFVKANFTKSKIWNVG